MSFDSWLNSRRESFRDKHTQQALKDSKNREQALETANRKADIDSTTLEHNLFATTDRLETSTNEVNTIAKQIELEQINNKINKGGLTAEEIAELNEKEAFTKICVRQH